eukprot:403337869
MMGPVGGRSMASGISNSGMLISKTSQSQKSRLQQNNQPQMTQLQQDTSPMRVTLDLWDQNKQYPTAKNSQNHAQNQQQYPLNTQQQQYQYQNQGSDVKPNQIHNYYAKGANLEGKFNQYLNSNNNERNKPMANFNPSICPQQQVISQQHQIQNKQIQSPGSSLQNQQQFKSIPQTSQNSQNNSQRPSSIFLTNQNASNSRQQTSNQYEQMAQQYSLESLIKQANQKKQGQQQQQTSSHHFRSPSQQNHEMQFQQVNMYNFNNKIDNFVGDNDHVDEEYESSAEKQQRLDSKQNQRYYQDDDCDSGLGSNNESQEDMMHDQNYNEQYHGQEEQVNDVEQYQYTNEDDEDQELDEGEVESDRSDYNKDYKQEIQQQQLLQQDDSNYMQYSNRSGGSQDADQQMQHQALNYPDQQQDQNSDLSDQEQFNQLQDHISAKPSTITNLQDQNPTNKHLVLSPDHQKNNLLDNEEDYGFSSDQKYRLSLTPGQNIIESDQQQMPQQQQQNHRIFSDLSAKVVNIGGLTALQNPFQSQNEVTLQVIQNLHNSSNSKQINQKEQQFQHSNYQSIQQPVNQTSDFIIHDQQFAQKFLQTSDVCNYDSSQQQNNITQQNSLLQDNQTLNMYDRSKLQSITPFDMMKSDYLTKKQEVLIKYSESDVKNQKQLEDIGQDQKQLVNQLFSKNDSQNDEIIPQAKIIIESNKISGSTAQFFDQLKTVDGTRQAKTQKSQMPENKFLTFDDFLNRSSIQQQQATPDVTNQIDPPQFNVITTKINLPISQHQSPRKNQLTKLEDSSQNLQQRTQIQNSRMMLNSKSPRPQDIKQKEIEQELKKKREIEMLKLKAKEKEQMRIRRIESAVRIQKVVRGFIQRKILRKQQENFKYMRKFRRLMSVAYGKYRLKFLQQLCSMISQAHENKKMMDDDMFRKYVEHCVTFIQKVWKGYYSRNFKQVSIINRYKYRRALNAVVKGWKIRRILSSCREVIAIKRDMNDLEKQFGLAKGPKDPLNVQIMQQRRKKIEELCKLVPQLFKNGRWIFSIQKKLVQSQINHQKKNLMQSKPQNYSQSIVNNQNAKSQIFNQTQKLQKQVDFDNHRDQSPIQVQRNNNKNIVFSDQQNPRKQDHQISQQTFGLPQASQRSQDSVDSSIVLWPSQRQNQFQTTGKVTQDDMLNTDRGAEAQSDIPVTQRTAIADKIQTLDHNQINPKNKPQFRQQHTFDHNQEETSGISWLQRPQTNNVEDTRKQQQNRNGMISQQYQEETYDRVENRKQTSNQQYFSSNQSSIKKSPFSKKQFNEDFKMDLQSQQQQTRFNNNNNRQRDQYEYDNGFDQYDNNKGAGNYSTFSNSKQQQQKLDFYPSQKQSARNQFEDEEDQDFYEVTNGYRNHQNKGQNHNEDRPLQSQRNQRPNQQQNNYKQFNDEDQQEEEQEIRQSNKRQNQPVNIDDIPIKPSLKNPYEEFMREDADNLKAKKAQNEAKNIDDIPIKPPKKNPQFDDNEFINEDRCVKAVAEKQFSTNSQFKSLGGSIDDSQIVPPKYNFEEMLEKAMLDQGMDPGVSQVNDNSAKKKGMQMRRSKTTRPQEESDEDQQSDNGLPPTKKALKKENLKKRQKYDPRKAIEEAKKKEEESQVKGQQDDDSKTNKRAIPDQGSSKNKKVEDRIRSQTSQPKTSQDETKSRDQSQKPNRKTLKQVEAESQEKQHAHDNDQASQDGVQSTTNASSSAPGQGAPKQFLKRKTQAVKFQKVDWKVRSRIDCWTNKGAEKDSRSNNISQTRRKTSALRSPKAELPPKAIVGQKQDDSKQQANIKKISQVTLNKVEQQQQPINPQNLQKSQVPSITNSFSQVPIQSLNLIQNQMVQNSKSVIKLNNNQHVPHHFQDETIDVESIPDENDQEQYYEAPAQQNKQQSYMNFQQNPQNFNNIPMTNQMQVQSLGGLPQQPHLQNIAQLQSYPPTMNQINQDIGVFNHSPPQYQQQMYGLQEKYQNPSNSSQTFTNMMNQYNNLDRAAIGGNQGVFTQQQQQFQNMPTNATTYQTQQNQAQYNTVQDEGQQADTVTLKLEELEKVYEMFHPREQTFEDCQIQDMITRDTLIPHMSTDSMFFTCYSDDIYDTILEELKFNYNQLCNESNE